MIKILHVVSNLTISSGVMHVIMNYYRHIDRKLVQFDFLFFEEGTYSESNYMDEINKLGGKIYYVNKPSFSSFFSSFKEFDDFFIKHANQYCAVHLHELYLVHFIKYFSYKYNIRHLIANAHSSKFSENKIKAIRNRILCAGIAKSATNLFACSRTAAKCYYGDDLLKGNKVYYLHNAIDLDIYRFNEEDRIFIRREYGVQDKIIIGHIGRMVPVKNHLFIVEQFSKLKKINADVVLFLVGDGPLRKRIEEKIKELAIEDSVYLLGIRKDVPRVLSAMDYFWLPSLHEGFPVTGVEAQANGLKCFFSSDISEEVVLSNKSKRISLINWDKYIGDCQYAYDRNLLDRKLLEFDIKIACSKLEKAYLTML